MAIAKVNFKNTEIMKSKIHEYLKNNNKIMSKKIYLLIAITFSIAIFAQVPQGISYQAIALNGSGNPVVSSNVGIRLSVLDNSATGTVLYTETHTKTTNAQGLFNLVIGQGSPTTGTFSTINWGTNSKFLKVELDAAGGTNYILTGTTQLLSVPYALAADSLVTSPGEGITLVSPNGTPYLVTVNDSGQLSLPTSNIQGSVPNSLYLYGSFNNFDTTTSLLMPIDTYQTPRFYGYKYLTAGSQLKFTSGQNSGAPIYGLNATLNLVPNGSSANITSDGLYLVVVAYPQNTTPGILSNYVYFDNTFQTKLVRNPYPGPAIEINGTYNNVTNTFSFIANGITAANNLGFYFDFLKPFYTGGGYQFSGDNSNDGTCDFNGGAIFFPNTTTTPKNFKVELVINFNGTGTYTITQI
jgi:hypothetical protein